MIVMIVVAMFMMAVFVGMLAFFVLGFVMLVLVGVAVGLGDRFIRVLVRLGVLFIVACSASSLCSAAARAFAGGTSSSTGLACSGIR